MEEKKLRDLIYTKFIKPTENRTDSFIGVEIEMPIINLSGEKADQELAQNVFEQFVDNFGFKRDSFDDNGVCYSATHPENEDNISFDCSYNNLELSLGREEDLNEIYNRFKEYVTFLNSNLEDSNHLLSGFGINPNYEVNEKEFIPVGHYRLLGQNMANYRIWDAPFNYHHYDTFGTYCSASQVQLDVNKDNLLDTINSFSQVEPYKAILFSNSVLTKEPEYNCVRDYLYNGSTIGFNRNNIGMYEKPFESIDEIIDYKMDSSLFNVIRDDRFILFKPIPIREYFNQDTIKGEVYNGEEFEEIEFTPQIEDLTYFRTYDFEDVTFRGTIEFRSCCDQPFSDSMSVAAIHLGWIKKLPELVKLLKNDPLHETEYSPIELREIAVRKDWRENLDEDKVKDFLIKLLDLAKEGLIERGRGEEKFLEPLYFRAENLINPSEFVTQNFDDNKELIIRKFADFDEVNPLSLDD